MSEAIIARFKAAIGRLGSEPFAVVGAQLEQIQTDAEALTIIESLEQAAAQADADALELTLSILNRG